MQEDLGILRALINHPSAVSINYQQVDNLHKLIMDQLPYGQIDPEKLVQGQIEFDGSGQYPNSGKTPLQWHFGGIPHEICKAIRIQYSYPKYFSGEQVDISGSLFIGYEVIDRTLTLARAVAELEVNKDSMANALETENNLAQLRSRLEEAHRQRAEQLLDAERTRARAASSIANKLAMLPGTVTQVARHVDANSFDEFLAASFPFRTDDERAAMRMGIADKNGSSNMANRQPTALSQMLSRNSKGTPPGVRVEYDGPAREYTSHKPFPYTLDTLFNDSSGLYDRLLWWYFGGKAYRITKAMRIPYEQEFMHGGLLIGYQGPAPH